MNKRVIAFLTALVTLLCIPMAAFADDVADDKTVHITCAEDLKKLANSCILDSYSQGLTVVLDNDVSLSNEPFSPIPIFSGKFDGKGHTISGFILGTDGSHQGFIRYIEKEGSVVNLTLKGSCRPEASRSQIGGIAGVNDGTIRNCTFEGEVSGLNYVGGIAGVNNGSISLCVSKGKIGGKRFTGGITGYCAKGAEIIGCTNQARVNTEITEGGIDVDKLNISNALETLNLVSIQDENVVADTGGIVGCSQGTVQACRNEEKVGYPHYGYNVGGIAGRQSGYLYDCENNAQVFGRNDVAGIVGQMEPYLLLKDKQTMFDALDNLYRTTNIALGNLGQNSKMVNEELNIVNDSAVAAKDFYIENDGDVYTFDEETGELTIDPAFSDYLNNIGTGFAGVNSSLSTTVQGAAYDFSGVNAAAYVVMNMAASALSGNLSLTVYDDISDDENESDTDGRVSGNVNNADIEGDRNTGGIAGNMAVELEYDMEGSLLNIFEARLDKGIEAISYQSKAVCYKNINNGQISTKKDYCGGIVGYQDVGTVSRCENYGNVSGTEGFAGGVCGRSNSVIKKSYAMCNVSGEEYVGGVAGYGVNILNCGTLVRMDDATAAFGAIAGYAYDFDEKSFGGNKYVSKTLGAIDGISYDGLAQAVNYSDFVCGQDVPDRMKDLRLTFKADGKTVKTIPFTYGGSISSDAVPAVPAKPGYSGAWPEFDNKEICYSEIIEAEYYPHLGAVASEETREENGLPLIVIDGDFDTSTRVNVKEYKMTEYPEVNKTDDFLEAYSVRITGEFPAEDGYTLRYLAPGIKMDNHKIVLFRLENDGSWSKIDSEEMGSYVSFKQNGDAVTFCAYDSADFTSTIILIALIALGVVLVGMFLSTLLKDRRARKQRESEMPADDDAAGEKDDSQVAKTTETEKPVDEAKADSESTTPKRRGRPKKTDDESKSAHVETTDLENADSGTQVNPEVPAPKKRGRPKKAKDEGKGSPEKASDLDKMYSLTQDNPEAAAPKKRGRPKKAKEESEVSSKK